MVKAIAGGRPELPADGVQAGRLPLYGVLPLSNEDEIGIRSHHKCCACNIRPPS